MLKTIQAATERHTAHPRRRRLANVLLADSELRSRLALKSILSAAGYHVDGAATSAEAVSHLDDREYQLVLADLRRESEEAGSRVLAYARQKGYRPATALLSSELHETGASQPPMEPNADHLVRMSDDNVSYLLANVADLIGERASRRSRLSSRPSLCRSA